jgi:hypothetical protein
MSMHICRDDELNFNLGYLSNGFFSNHRRASAQVESQKKKNFFTVIHDGRISFFLATSVPLIYIDEWGTGPLPDLV